MNKQERLENIEDIKFWIKEMKLTHDKKTGLEYASIEHFSNMTISRMHEELEITYQAWKEIR